jgi:hypothetical protein
VEGEGRGLEDRRLDRAFRPLGPVAVAHHQGLGADLARRGGSGSLAVLSHGMAPDVASGLAPGMALGGRLYCDASGRRKGPCPGVGPRGKRSGRR